MWSLRVVVALFVISLFVSALTGCGETTQSHAILTTMSGNVTVLKPDTGTWLEGQVGMTLSIDYTVKTDTVGRATITFPEGSTVELEGSTEIRVANLSISTGTPATTISLRQEIGKTTSRVKKLIDPASRYEIETPAAVALVRGSVMFVDVVQDGNTTVGNEEGNISVVAQGVEVLIPEGQHSSVTTGQPPSPPEPGTTKPLIASISNVRKNEGLKPPPAPENADWWYYNVTLRNESTIGITLEKRQNHYTNPRRDWSDDEYVFKNLVSVPAGEEVIFDDYWVWFSRWTEPYPATVTLIFYGKDDLGNDLQTTCTLTVNVD